MSFSIKLKTKIDQFLSAKNNLDADVLDFFHSLRDIADEKNEDEKNLTPDNSIHGIHFVELFKTILNDSNEVIQISDASGQRIFVNQRAMENFKISSHQLGNLNLETFKNNFYFDDASWQKHLDKLKTVGTLVFEDRVVDLGTDNKFIGEFTEKLVDIGGQLFVISTMTDVTEKKEHIKIIRLLEKKYRNIISNINLGLLELDNDERILFCNSEFEKMANLTSKEINGKKIEEIITLKSAWLVEDLGMSKSHQSFKLEVNTNENANLWWLMSSVSNYNENGTKVGTLRIIMDITMKEKMEIDLKQAYQDAKDAALAKESFLANMSHEIRTPLNAILGMIREIGREQISDKQKHHLLQADSAANHLTSLINSILDMSKIDAGKFQLDEQEFSLHSFVQNIESILYTKAESKNIFLNFNLDPQIEPVHIGDEPRLRQIFINLIDNAIKFTSRGGVSIFVKSLNKTSLIQKIEFVVKDTGIGMDENYLNEIFTKYSQESTSTTRNYGGTGLGMPITRELIQLMGGKMNISSTKGIGTEISIELFLPIGSIENLRKESLLIEQNSLKGLKVLLIDDNEMNRYIALQSLHYFGCLVEEAENGQIAVDILKETTFDVIFMDIQMPIMDGITATKIIRNDLKLKTPIIALTANAFKEETRLYLEVGMNGYVTKPYREELLHDEIVKVTVG